MKEKMCFIIFFSLFSLSASSQDNKYRLSKADLELSGFIAETTCKTHTTLGNKASSALYKTTYGGALLFSYYFREKQAISIGSALYIEHRGFNFRLDKDEYDLPYSIVGQENTKIPSVCVPVFYSTRLPVSNTLLISSGLGVYGLIPLKTSGEYSTWGYTFNGDQETILLTQYYDFRLSGGIYADLSVLYPFRTNSLKISLFALIAFPDQFVGEYTFFSESSEYVTEGQIQQSLLVGLKIAWVFALNLNREQ